MTLKNDELDNKPDLKKQFYEEQAKKYKQFSFSIDGDKPVVEQPTVPTIKKEIFSSPNNSIISHSHTIKFQTPTTTIQSVDRKYELHGDRPSERPSVSPPLNSPITTQGNEPVNVSAKSEVSTEPLKVTPFTITDSQINLGSSQKRVAERIINDKQSAPGSASVKSTPTEVPFNVTKKDLINQSYVQLNDRVENTMAGGISMLGSTAYRTLEQGDDSTFTDARHIKDGVVVVTSFNATGRTIGRQVGNVNKVLSDNKDRIQNAGRYIKGAEVKDFKQHKDFKPYTQKQYEQKLRTFSDISDRKMKSINAEIKTLKNRNIQLSPEQQQRLAYLMNFKSLKNEGKLLKEDITTMGNVGFIVRNGMSSIMQDTDNSGIQGMMSASDVVGNRYVRNFASSTAKATFQGSKAVAHTTGMGIKFVSDKTGLTKQINKGTAKLMETQAAQTVKTATTAVKTGIHGGIYQAAKQQYILNAPDALKKTVSTAQTVTTTTTKAVNTAMKPVKGAIKTGGKAVGKGYKIVSAPARWAKKASAVVKTAAFKLGKYLAFGLLGGMAVVMMLGGIMSLIMTITSVFATEDLNIQRWADYVVELQDEYKESVEAEAAELMEENDSLHDVTYVYSDKQTFSNGKEILSMAGVYFEQDWPDWYEVLDAAAMKNYIHTLFYDSHTTGAEFSEEYECSGCKTRHYSHPNGCRTNAETGERSCPGHTETYCSGHRDVTIYLTTLGFDDNKIFFFDSTANNPDASRNWDGWNAENIEWANNFYNQNWFDLYGVSFGGDDFIPSPISASDKREIMDKILEQYPNLSEERQDLIETAISLVGSVPYFWGGGHHQNLEPGYDVRWGTELMVVTAPGYDAQPAGTSHLYGLDCSGFSRWAILTSTGSDTMYAGARGQRINLGTAVSLSNLQPGDFANTSNDGHVGIYLYTDDSGKMFFVHCSPSVNGVGINAPGYFTRYYTPKGID